MACGTAEDNDPYKIHINLEDDEDGERKRFFEKGLKALLDDKYFLLLYVPENGGRMQVVRPANDSYHRKRMIKRINEAKPVPSFYYALSHLWGLREDNRYYWNEISDYVDDEEGQSMEPVSMRPEKRAPLLQLLRDHPDSYWWIDVLCARYDTPLDIMGDIYACCLECIAMIDCEPTLIPKIRIELDAIEGVKRFQEHFGRTSEYQQYIKTKIPQLIEPLYTFFQCEWWQRVWTWQEMALPRGDVRFVAETCICQHQIDTITLNELLVFLRVLKTYGALKHDIEHETNGQLATLSEVYGRLNDIFSATISIYVDMRARLNMVILSLSISERRCYDPCDYIYGVLGVMQIKIPRMSDPNEVWRELLSKMDDLNPLENGARRIDNADRFDLREAKNIGEVYFAVLSQSLTVTFEVRRQDLLLLY